MCNPFAWRPVEIVAVGDGRLFVADGDDPAIWRQCDLVGFVDEAIGDASPVTNRTSPRYQSPHAASPNVTARRAGDAAKARRYRARRRAARLGLPVPDWAAKRPTRVPASPIAAPSLSLFPDLYSEQEKEQKRRAPDPGDAGFAELRRIWPLRDRMTEAAAEYRRALREVGATELLALAQRYLAEKEPWRGTLQLRNWLRAKPWHDALLPLAAPPVLVAAAKPRAPPEHGLGPPGDRLIARVGRDAFDRWFAGLAIAVTADRVTVTAPSRFIRNRLAEHYDGDICAAWRVRHAEFRWHDGAPEKRETG